MKALIKKYPINAKKEDENEVYLQGQWHDWIGQDGSPLTDENFGYALCENVPDGAEPTMENFDVVERTRTEPDPSAMSEDGTPEVKTVKFWTATYVEEAPRSVENNDIVYIDGIAYHKV